MHNHALNQKLKRAMDLIIGTIAFVIAIPLFVLVPLFLKLEGQSGSIFYSGMRVGKNGKLFKCWKFRSMEDNSDHLLQEYLDVHPEERESWEKYHKLKNDPRVKTRRAKILRKTSLDEIPQIFNVFRGEMSLIGPRPILEREIEKYGDNIHYYTSIKPGITGKWQVSGRNRITFRQRAEIDAEYVQNWSLFTDFMILLKTVRVVLSGAGAH